MSKQLFPVHDKPMIYCPLSTLLLAVIREVLIITTPHDQGPFERLLGHGDLLRGAAQPGWSSQAFLIGAEFFDGSPAPLVLGANPFHDHDLVAGVPRSGVNPWASAPA